MPCTPPPPTFVAEPSAWVALAPGAESAPRRPAIEDGGHHGARNAGGGIHLELGGSFGTCALGFPGYVQVAVTGDGGTWQDGGNTGAFGLAVEAAVVDLGEGALLGARIAGSYGDKYTPLASYLTLGSNADVEVGVRVRYGVVKVGLDAFVSPPRTDATPSAATGGVVVSVGATGRPGIVASAVVAAIAVAAVASFFHYEANRND